MFCYNIKAFGKRKRLSLKKGVIPSIFKEREHNINPSSFRVELFQEEEPLSKKIHLDNFIPVR